MTSTQPTLAPEIAAFAAAVRAELADLSAEEIDDLTDGLEADLADSVADRPDEDFGDPSVYAAELRAAAGHQPRAARSHVGGTGSLPSLRSIPGILRARWLALVERRPVLAGAVAILVALRPVWWVFRGAVLPILVLLPVVGGTYGAPMNGWMWLAALAGVIVSVQIGRGIWLRSSGAKRAIAAANAVVVIAAPFLLGSALGLVNNMYNAYYWESTPYIPNGLTHNGVNVSNIYAYDAAGNPIERVQLFDQSGEPINLAGDPEMQWTIGSHDTPVVPSSDVVGRPGWNVYPLWELTSLPSDPGAFSDLREPEFPFVVVRPLSGHESSAGDVGSTGEAAGN
jgi:hypothetical protein